MSSYSTATEPCPKCMKLHEQGPYLQDPNSNRVAPKDVVCSCGLELRWSVPLFKTNESGYVLRILRDDEVLFT